MKKGFTLIELLAVILILGIIALIAIPTVNNILKEARRGAFSSTLNNLEKAIEEKCTLEQIKNQAITTNYSITNGVISPSLDIKGDLPDGTITVNSNCEVSFTLSDKNFTGTKDFVGEITITDGSTDTGVVYKETILNGTDPVLNNGLIPVTIANDGTVKKADITKKWYSYEEKMWANAVILNSGDYKVGDTIPESAIRAYFVWIPKYKYQLWNVDVTGTKELTHSIDIIFDTTNTTDTSTSCATPMTSGGTGNCSNGKYMTHPAFISMDVNGFWVGKYELTGLIDNLTVKPNSVSLKSQTVASFFSAMYNFNRNLDSHMMKNTEWGAVAYLSHSKFGIDKEININNNSAYKTGYSAKLTTQQGIYPGEYGDDGNYNVAYNTTIGYLASTTGNISGIYDMAGGAYEYMASYRSGASIPTADAKYFDVYNASSALNTYNYRILGDATGEMGPFINYKDGDTNPRWHNKWYGDYSYFVESTSPWFYRGGVYGEGVLAGQFHFNRFTGAAYGSFGSRLVLAAK